MVRVLISLDERLLERLDREARARSVSRSRLLSELAARGLGKPIGPEARPDAGLAIDRIRRLFDEVTSAADSTDVIRAQRDERAARDAGLG